MFQRGFDASPPLTFDESRVNGEYVGHVSTTEHGQVAKPDVKCVTDCKDCTLHIGVHNSEIHGGQHEGSGVQFVLKLTPSTAFSPYVDADVETETSKLR
jgi:hypothetical protein